MVDVLMVGLILLVFLMVFRIVFVVFFVSGIFSEFNVLGLWWIINLVFFLILVLEVNYMMKIINRKLVKYKIIILFFDFNWNINFYYFIYFCFDYFLNFFWLKVREKYLVIIVRGWFNLYYLWFFIYFWYV